MNAKYSDISGISMVIIFIWFAAASLPLGMFCIFCMM